MIEPMKSSYLSVAQALGPLHMDYVQTCPSMQGLLMAARSTAVLLQRPCSSQAATYFCIPHIGDGLRCLPTAKYPCLDLALAHVGCSNDPIPLPDSHWLHVNLPDVEDIPRHRCRSRTFVPHYQKSQALLSIWRRRSQGSSSSRVAGPFALGRVLSPWRASGARLMEKD